MTVLPAFTTGQVFTAAAANNMANSGLTYVKQQTIGNGVASVTVSDAFSATYDNYKIVINGGATSAQTSISLQLG